MLSQDLRQAAAAEDLAVDQHAVAIEDHQVEIQHRLISTRFQELHIIKCSHDQQILMLGLTARFFSGPKRPMKLRGICRPGAEALFH